MLFPSPRILLVADETLHGSAMQRALKPDRYEFTVVADGRSACETTQLIRPDLVVVDVSTSGIDGFQVCRQLRAIPCLAGLPIILHADRDDEASRIKGCESGADGLFAKTISGGELRVRVRTMIQLGRSRTASLLKEFIENLSFGSPGAILLFQPDGTLATCNGSASELIMSADSFPGDPAGVTSLNRVMAALSELARNAAQAAKTPPPVELQIQRKTGEATVIARALKLRQRGAPIVVLLEDAKEDIPAPRRQESRGIRFKVPEGASAAQLAEIDRLIDSYTVFIAHDLRNSLTILRGYLSLLASELIPLPEIAKEPLDKACEASALMTNTVNDILCLTAAGSAHPYPPAPLDPNPILQQLCGMLKGAYSNPLIRLKIDPLPPLPTSPALLRRVMFNLVSNALKFSADQPEPRVEIGAADTPEGPVLFVRDNGIGFQPSESHRLYAEYSRMSGSDRFEGLGLGLSLVARLLEAHGGAIRAESKLHGGSTFYVRFGPPQPSRDTASVPALEAAKL